MFRANRLYINLIWFMKTNIIKNLFRILFKNLFKACSFQRVSLYFSSVRNCFLNIDLHRYLFASVWRTFEGCWQWRGVGDGTGSSFGYKRGLGVWARGVWMSLMLSRFIAASNWKLHRLCRFQFRFVVWTERKRHSNSKRHWELKQATARQ